MRIHRISCLHNIHTLHVGRQNVFQTLIAKRKWTSYSVDLADIVVAVVEYVDLFSGGVGMCIDLEPRGFCLAHNHQLQIISSIKLTLYYEL